jgi:hypothetical protein
VALSLKAGLDYHYHIKVAATVISELAEFPSLVPL